MSQPLDSVRPRGHRAPAWLREGAKSGLRKWGLVTAGLRPAPDFLIIGTKRGGTTSLFHYLLQHPQVVPMFPARRLKSPHYFYWHYDRGERWYRSHFATSLYRRTREGVTKASTVTGEASPYYLYHPYTPQRVHEFRPDVRLIVMLRDPVKRAYSHYWERVDNGVEPLSFDEALAAEPERLAGEIERMAVDPLYYSRAHDWYAYRDRGVYAPQLRRWFGLFAREQVLVVFSEDFYASEQAVVDRVTDFLAIERHQLVARPRYNYRPAEPMSEATEVALREFYRPHNNDLADLLGKDPGWPR